jgi:hypothetical protein
MFSFIVGYGQAVLQATVNVQVTLPSIAILDIEPNTSNISFSIATLTEAGNAITVAATNNTKWLNFTSSVFSSGTRKITASLGTAFPGGMSLKLLASASGTGEGARGSSSGTITLSTTPQNIINNIGGAYTGNGINMGYNLNYSLTLDTADYALLRSQSTSTQVLFTIMDN